MSRFIKILKRWKEVLLITCSVRISLLILGIFLNPGKNLNPLYYWIQWDGPHYIDLAKNWYQSSGEQSLWIVFYPLYPILIKVFNFFINDFSSSAIIVSLFFSFTAAIFLYELVLLDSSRRTAILSVWFLNIFPASYFLQGSYGESIFLTTCLSTVYFFRRNSLNSAFTGILATMARVNGILLMPLLLIELKSIKKTMLTLLVTPLGSIFYLLINFLTFGNPLYFVKPLQENWYKKTELPWVGIKNLIYSIPPYNNVLFYAYISELISLSLIFFLSIYVFLKIRKSYGVYMFLSFILFSSTSFIMSTPRYMLAVFPIFIALGYIKNRLFIAILSLAFIILLIYFTSLYIKGQWAF